MILFDGGKVIAEGDSIERTVTLGEGQRMNLNLLVTGGGKAEFNVDLCAPGADFLLKGLYACTGDDRLEIKINLTHSAGGSVSNQLFRGLVSGRARAYFDGRITVAPDAQKTEAYQTNRNLQLSDDALVSTSPQLEIYADDVKCSHGATVGSLDEDEQFYMRSRGITLQQARRLQVISFLAPVMEGLPDDVREDLSFKLAEMV